MHFQRLILGLLVGSLGLPVALCLLFAVSWMLQTMQDVEGALALRRIAFGGYIVWALTLFALLVALALATFWKTPHNQCGSAEESED